MFLKNKYFRKNGGMVLLTQRTKIFSAKELAKATDNYADNRKLGEGGFAAVYRGVLPDDTQVAVKKSKTMDKAKIDDDFQREITAVLAANHKNVVKLVALCLETKVPLLVYEFIPNGSLSMHIHNKSSQVLASWGNRLRIAAESALGLYYLHSLADPPVIHGDVKSANILIDNDYSAKIADFGASMFISPGQANVMYKIQGTRGYLDPEYFHSYNLTEKSDVYSFGVVLVELLTGKTPYFTSDGENYCIIPWFILALDRNDLFNVLCFRPSGEGEMLEIKAVAELAKRCVSKMREYRPTMKEVSDELAKLQEHHQTDHLHGESSYSFVNNSSVLNEYFRENGGMVLKIQGIKIFGEAELGEATNNYTEDRRLGEGGFGDVYKGFLPDGTQVAVKRAKTMDKAMIGDDFQREINAVSKVNHKNVVKLVGLCLETEVPLLVYEFIPNGSLFNHIHDKSSQALASWGNRLRIASESALALYYLHHLANPPVIHGDVKPANILLDNDYTAKVADFGASVFISPGQVKAKKVLGTFGYQDPVYLGTGDLTERSDVYSFGVVLLELLTGKQPYFKSKSGEMYSNIECFSLALENNELFSILDFQHTGADEMHEIEAVAKLAKRCVSNMRAYRPTMKEVSDELEKLQKHHQTDHLLSQLSLFDQ